MPPLMVVPCVWLVNIRLMDLLADLVLLVRTVAWMVPRAAIVVVVVSNPTAQLVTLVEIIPILLATVSVLVVH